MELIEDSEFSRRFPAERWARVRIVLRDGRTFVSDPAIARGNPENPLTEDEIGEKFRALSEPVLGAARSSRIDKAVRTLALDSKPVGDLVTDLLQAAGDG